MREGSQLIVEGNEVRGLYCHSFTPEYTLRLGRAFGDLVKETYGKKESGPLRVAIGFDARPSSWELQNSLVRGLAAQGVNVFNLGQAPSPLVYFSVHHLKANGGVILTGSHRSLGWNGARFYLGRQPLESKTMNELLGRSQRAGGRDILPMLGQVTYLNMVPDYLRSIQREFEPVSVRMGRRRIQVVVAGYHGVSSLTAPSALSRIGCRILKLGCVLNGAIQYHSLDPSDPVGLRGLGATVRAAKADFGVAFDGDGDCIRVVDHRGEPVRADHLLMLFASSMAERIPGTRVACDLRVSDCLEEVLRKWHGSVIHVPPGHVSRMEVIRSGEVLLAGDSEGHYHFADRHLGFDDGTYAALRLVEILAQAHGESREEITLRSLLAISDRYVAPEKVIPLRDDQPVLGALADLLRKRKCLGAPVRSIQADHSAAVRVRFVDGWGVAYLAREDRTIRLRYEASTESAFHAIGALLRETLEESLALSAPRSVPKRALS